MVDEISVAHCERNHQVVVVFGEVVEFRSCAKINAAVGEIITCSGPNAHVVEVLLVLIAGSGLQHEAVGDEIAGGGVEPKAEFFVRTV